jgi:hypothetical protein
MNQDRLFTTLGLAATLAFSITTVQAEYVSPSFEAKLQAAADGGPAQVNQLLYRTRAIHNLTMDEAMHHVQLPAAEGSIDGNGAEAAVGEAPELSQGGDYAPVETGTSSQDDAFTREFFRNDARD